MKGPGEEQSIQIQNRDVLVLRGLLEARVMTLAHIATLYFDNRAEAAKKRLLKLKRAGLVAERPRRTCEPSVLFLTRRALHLLRERGELGESAQVGLTALERRARVSDASIQHELAVSDVRAAFTAAIAGTADFRISDFSTWPSHLQFYAKPSPSAPEVLLKPDGYFCVDDRRGNGRPTQHRFFIELDRASETQAVLAKKARCYVDYYRRGGFAIRFGGHPEDYKRFPFRVLMVFTHAGRQALVTKQLLNCRPPILTQVVSTTVQKLQSDPLGPIWARPIDFRNSDVGSEGHLKILL